MKKIMTLLLAILMAASLTACGGGGAKNLSVDDLLAKNADSMAEVKSYEASITMDMYMSLLGESIDMDMTMDMIYFADQEKFKLDMTASMLGESETYTAYGQLEDGAYYTYTNESGVWEKETAISKEDFESALAMSDSMQYVNSLKDAKTEGSESINGVQTTKISGSVELGDLESLLSDTGAMDDLSELFGDSALDNIEAIPLTLWIEAETGYLHKASMDMSDYLKSMMDTLIEMLSAIMDEDELEAMKDAEYKFIMDMEMKNFNNATEFEIPDSVKEI